MPKARSTAACAQFILIAATSIAHTMIKLTSKLVSACISFALLANCATNPVTGKRDLVLMSEQQEIQLGSEAAKEISKEYAPYRLQSLQDYVNQIGQRLAAQSHRPGLKYTFTVVDSPEVNAFALPGGHIYITRGILAYLGSEAELAGVLGHEIGHVTARHSVRQQSQGAVASIGAAILGAVLESQTGVGGFNDVLGAGATAYVRGYGRDQELEADRLGAEYLARAGYDPQAMIKVVGVLKNQELFDAEVAKGEGREPRRHHGLFETHPDADRRLKEVVASAGPPAMREANDGRAAYLRAISGVTFGDTPDQGVVRNGKFYHEGLGFMVEFPPEWRIQNRPDAVIATPKALDAAIDMRLIQDAMGNPADILRQRLKPDQVHQLENRNINGLVASRIVATKGGRPFQATGIRMKDDLFVFIGLGKDSQAFIRNQPMIDRATATFRAMTDAERAAIRPYLIRTAPAKPGDTFAALAKRSPLTSFAEQHLRLINQRYPTGEPRPGEIMKIIE